MPLLYIHVLVVCHNILTVFCLFLFYFLAFAAPSRLLTDLKGSRATCLYYVRFTRHVSFPRLVISQVFIDAFMSLSFHAATHPLLWNATVRMLHNSQTRAIRPCPNTATHMKYCFSLVTGLWKRKHVYGLPTFHSLNPAFTKTFLYVSRLVLCTVSLDVITLVLHD